MISEYFGLARFVAAVGIAGIVVAVCFFYALVMDFVRLMA
jgi:hypothetical protein